MAQNVKKRCFIIMPFSKTTDRHTEEYWTSHYESFLKPLIEEHSLSAYRSSALRGDILRQIITDLVTAHVAVADLTDKNPNVYWELGVRQSFKHCTITIAEEGTILPFDLGAKGTLYYYPSNHIKMAGFKSQFSAAIEDCLKNPDSPDSHVLETIGGRGTLFQILTKQETWRKLGALAKEIINNCALLDVVKNMCIENAHLREQKSTCHIITGRFRTIAAEALIVNRYVDASDEFYGTAERYLDGCVRFNEQISAWDFLQDAEIVEKWLLDRCDKEVKLFQGFLELAQEEREKTESSV